MLSYAYSQSSSSSSSPSRASSPLDWADWVPECLHPAIAIANEMAYHRSSLHLDEDEEEEEAEEEIVDDAEDDDDEEEILSAAEAELHHAVGIETDGSTGSETRRFSHLPRRRHHTYSRSTLCLSCNVPYDHFGAGTCRECYEEASETKDALKKEIEELQAQIAFLKAWAPEAMDEGCADIVIECSDGSQIRAHRAILISRSSVFKAMLESKMEESRTNTIRITDFPYKVLRLFIGYLYTAEIYPESLDECAFDLLALAEKYHVNQLKSVCERYMISKVNSANALSNFEYASLHGAKALKEAALNAIMENIHDLPTKNEYQDLVNRDAKLVVEIYESYLTKKSGKSAAQ